ncbi:hypothetical protein RHGRI_013448 [Rhododendron griersonianum]|uniref:RNA-dependent RNA polymerase n=1 Tax=Rhododendron griersonianum TaxID=479676 RepID=A0AAV6K5L2_9ERIC|nr:hypothetical protein RHGRI_013448 [Rhododendron griersonianum]
MFSDQRLRTTVTLHILPPVYIFLVPIISPPWEIDFPYEILFRICLLIHRECLAGPTLDIDFFKLIKPREHGPLCVQHALDKLVHPKECCYDPLTWLHEEMGKLFYKDLLPGIGSSSEERRTSIYGRVLATLKDGIVIGEKKFDFLAYSSSQLTDNSAWMFASSEGLTVDDLRRWLGDFSQIRNVGKYSARLGQSLVPLGKL